MIAQLYTLDGKKYSKNTVNMLLYLDKDLKFTCMSGQKVYSRRVIVNWWKEGQLKSEGA